MQRVKISPEAAQELEEAAAWYEEEQAGLGSRLILSFENALKLLNEPSPPMTSVEGEAAKLGAKKLILHKISILDYNHRIESNDCNSCFSSSLQKAWLLEDSNKAITVLLEGIIGTQL